MPIPALLDELLRAPGPSGGEDPVQAIVRREAASFGAELTGDVLGSTVARVAGSVGGRTLALVAHTDQVGVGLTRPDDNGLWQVGRLAKWDAASAVGQRFSILADEGPVPAVAVRTGDGELTWDAVRLDTGAGSRDEALAQAAPGDAAVLVGSPLELAGGRFASAAIDDRAGLYASLEALRRLAAQPPTWDVVLVASVQEEGGSHAGARAAVETLRPDVALVVEVTYASDAPSGYPSWGDLPLGGGPSVFRGPVVHPAVANGLVDVARRHGIPFGVETGELTWSDADDVFVVTGGIATGLVSLPLRFMHTANEIAQLSDVEHLSALVEAYARSLEADASFVR